MHIEAILWKPNSTNDFFRFYLKYKEERFGELVERTLGYVEVRNKELDFSNINPVYHGCLLEVFTNKIAQAAQKYKKEKGNASYLDIFNSFEFNIVETSAESDFTKEELGAAQATSDFLGLPRFSGEFANVLWATMLRLHIVQKIGADAIQNKKFKKCALSCDFWISNRSGDIKSIQAKAFYK